MMEELQSQKVVSIGGLNSNVNHIQLSDNEPGSAVELQNFEASLWGGYRRLSGYSPYSETSPEVDPTNAEGRIYNVSIFGDNIITARKQKSGNVYKFYLYNGTSWDPMTTGLPALSTLSLVRIRKKEFNFKGTQTLAFADGINPAMLYNGTNWVQITSAHTGANFANAGGNQAINVASCVDVFRNTLFIAHDNVVCYSAPLSEFDWTVASGAGQIPVGFKVKMIKPFRDNLYVFGENNIKYITLETVGSTQVFVLKDVTANMGCLAPDSVIEIDGNLLFLSQDGFRPIEGTDKIGDVQLETVSKKIQQLITEEIVSNDMEELTSVIVRNKSQVRFFFSSPSKEVQSTFGIIGCLRGDSQNGFSYEWGRLKGIRASCTESKYIGAAEFILHGDYDGKIHRQESTNSFDGRPVEATYSTPFLDFGDATVRKTLRKLRLFIRSEGNMSINIKLIYDWADSRKLNPATYSVEADTSGLAQYGSAHYGTSTYSDPATPVLIENIEGSGFSIQTKYTTVDTNPPYTIQGVIYQFSVEGRK